MTWSDHMAEAAFAPAPGGGYTFHARSARSFRRRASVGSGALDGMVALADRRLADCDENGWRDSAWLDPGEVAYPSSR